MKGLTLILLVVGLASLGLGYSIQRYLHIKARRNKVGYYVDPIWVAVCVIGGWALLAIDALLALGWGMWALFT